MCWEQLRCVRRKKYLTKGRKHSKRQVNDDNQYSRRVNISQEE